MKNIYTPKKKMFKTTPTFCDLEVAVGCWVLSLSTRYRDFSAIVSSAAPKKCALVDSTSKTQKTQGFGVGDRYRKMSLSRSSGAWSRFAHHCQQAPIHFPKPPPPSCLHHQLIPPPPPYLGQGGPHTPPPLLTLNPQLRPRGLRTAF